MPGAPGRRPLPDPTKVQMHADRDGESASRYSNDGVAPMR
jgi:hypothetical protein